MVASVVLGSQWGDEGKGKIIDFYASQADVVARFHGGDNAGHTVIVNDKKYVLHILPSGIINENCINILGNGVVINPEAFKQELEAMKIDGVNPEKRLFISSRAHVVLNYHKDLDSFFEVNSKKIGTTGKGIGPAYVDKVLRAGIRVADMIDLPILRQKIDARLDLLNQINPSLAFKADKRESLHNKYIDLANYIRPFVADTEYMINSLAKQGKKIMLEGAQGILLDIDFGTYPYVTSSNSVAANGFTGTGLNPKSLQNVIGVMKAYCTRVGEGPFPTELSDDTGEELRAKGKEFGATTGRPRRTGWLDLVAAKYSCMVSGINRVSFMKLDILSGFETIKVCVAYEYDGAITDIFPSHSHLDKITPIYKEFKGWTEDITECKSYDNLPKNAKDYLDFVKDFLDIEYSIISVGPSRNQSIFLTGIFNS